MQQRLKATISFSCLLCAGAMEATPGRAAVWYVDAASTGGSPTGTNWCDAYRNLQDALAVASFGDEVRVAGGVYRPDDGAGQTTGDRLATFVLKSGVTVVGGYAGCGTADPDARDLVLNETMLSGDLGGDDGPDFANRTDNSYHVVTYNDPNATDAVLDGFTVSGGYADGTGPANTNQGSGLHLRLDSAMCIPGGPTIRNCIVRDNWSLNHGAINIHTDAALIEDCTIRDNSTLIKGGGLLIQSGSSVVRNCAFINNSAVTEGGGAWLAHNEDPTCAPQSQPLIENCMFTDNVSLDKGGGLFVLSGDATVRGTEFNNNSASLKGGGAWIENSLDSANTPQGQHLFEDCTFVDNRAQSPNDNIGNGGAMSVFNSNATVRNCEFTNNFASSTGGGIWIENCDNPLDCTPVGDALIEDCVFTGNRADGLTQGHAGALWFLGTNLTVRNTAFVGNHAQNNGGASYGLSSFGTFENCIWDGNTAERGGGHYHAAINMILTIDDSLFQNNEADPLGGGLFAYASSPRISRTIFHANTARLFGGGAVISQDISTGCDGFCQTCEPGFCEAFLTDCEFRQNESQNGGGLHNGYAVRTILKRVVFEDNRAISGGGMFQDGINEGEGADVALSGSSVLEDCVFRGNKDLFTYGWGGGLYVKKGSTTLVRCDFLGNEQRTQGGGLFATDKSELDIWNSRFLGNRLAGSGSGSGVYVEAESDLTMTNTLLVGNANGNTGGGVTVAGGAHAVITNSTIAENTVLNSAGGAALFVDDADVQVRNSILWNGPEAEGDLTIRTASAGTSLDVLFSIAQGGWTGTGNIDGDPQFVDAAGPDGIAGTQDDNLRLSPTSPGVDAGDSDSLPQDSEDLDGDGNTTEPLPLDLDGSARISGNGVDIGAFELGGIPCSPGQFSPSGEEPCEPCPTGQFQPNEGATACNPCDCNDGNPCTTDNCDAVSGDCQPDPIENCVPAASEWGILALALVILTAGTLAVRRPYAVE